MTRRYLIIRNPVSGRVGKGVTRAVAAELGHLGVESEIMDTEPGSGTALARAGIEQGFDAILAAGGDGTVREVAKSMLGTGVPLGLIPVGTGNSLAREVKLGPDLSPAALAAALATAHTTRVFPGVVTLDGRDEIFLEEVSAGIDSMAVLGVTPELKQKFGPVAYVLKCLEHLARDPNADLEVELGGRRIAAGWVIVARAERYGGWFRLGSGVSLEDDDLAFVMVRHSPRRAFFRYLWGLLRGRFGSMEGVAVVRASEAMISAAGDLPAQIPVQADGDLIGRTPFSIRISDRPIDLITPAPM